MSPISVKEEVARLGTLQRNSASGPQPLDHDERGSGRRGALTIRCHIDKNGAELPAAKEEYSEGTDRDTTSTTQKRSRRTGRTGKRLQHAAANGRVGTVTASSGCLQEPHPPSVKQSQLWQSQQRRCSSPKEMEQKVAAKRFPARSSEPGGAAYVSTDNWSPMPWLPPSPGRSDGAAVTGLRACRRKRQPADAAGGREEG